MQHRTRPRDGIDASRDPARRSPDHPVRRDKLALSYLCIRAADRGIRPAARSLHKMSRDARLPDVTKSGSIIYHEAGHLAGLDGPFGGAHEPNFFDTFRPQNRVQTLSVATHPAAVFRKQPNAIVGIVCAAGRAVCKTIHGSEQITPAIATVC